ncbi:hypothetical protein NU219Hw_g106t1 [Hortaea werneckii]
MAASLRTQFTDFVQSLSANSYMCFKPVHYDDSEEDHACLRWPAKRARYRAGLEFPSDCYHQYWLAHDFESKGIPDEVRNLTQSAPSAARRPRKRAVDPISGCENTSASALQAPEPLTKKPKHSRVRREQPYGLRSEQHDDLPRRQSNRPRRERPWDLLRAHTNDLPHGHIDDLAREHPDTRIHEQHDQQSHEERVGQPYEQPDETSALATDEEQSHLPSELDPFVTSTGYLDHGRITQPLHARSQIYSTHT